MLWVEFLEVPVEKDQPVNLTPAERDALRSITAKLDAKDKKRPPKEDERDRSDSNNDFDKGVRFG